MAAGRFSLRAFSTPVVLLSLVLAGPARSADPLGPPLWQAGVVAVTDSFVTQAQRYYSIALPLVLADSSVGAVFEELGRPDDSRWRLGHRVPATAGYVSATAGLGGVTRGLGYWLITRDPATVRFTGIPDFLDTLEVPLERGPGATAAWNQVGNPFYFAINPMIMAVVKRDSVYAFGNPANPFTETSAKLWNPAINDYQNATFNIGINTAFWVRLKDTDSTSRWTVWPAGGPRPSPGAMLDLAVDRRGSPHILYGGTDDFVSYAYRVGSEWRFEQVTSPANDQQRCSIAIDKNDVPHAAFPGFDSNQGEAGLIYANRIGGTWSPELVDNSFSAGAYSSIALDSQNQPHIAYSADDYNHLRYVEKVSGSWISTVVDSLWSFECEVALDGNAAPHIAYVGHDASQQAELRYARRQGSTWTKETIYFAPGFGIAFALDPAGGPHIVFTDDTGNLRYASRAGTSWTTEPITGAGPGRRPSLTFDAQGNPHVSFYDSATPRLRYAKKIGGTWLLETVSTEPRAGITGTSIVRAPDGHPMIAHFGGNPPGGAPDIFLRLAERQRGDVKLKIPPFVALASAPAGGGTPPDGKPEGATWAVEISARSGGRSAEPLVIGVAPNALGMPNHARLGRAPQPPGALPFELAALVPAGTGVEALSRDLEPPAGRLEWTLSLGGGGGEAGEAELDFRAMDLPHDMKLVLADDLHGWQGEISPGTPTRVAFGATPRTLRLIAVRGALPGSTVTSSFRGAAPNPFREQSGLVFVLDRPSRIEVQVLDLQGRRVRTLVRDADGAGEHVVTWDGRDDHARPVAPGVYLARWSAAGASGAARLVRIR